MFEDILGGFVTLFSDDYAIWFVVLAAFVGIVFGVIAAIAVIDPHGFGLLAHGVHPPEIAVSVALCGVTLTTSFVVERKRNTW